ncbi:MAG: DNA polymerase III subunit beta [Verrucomicrobiota bacterium]
MKFQVSKEAFSAGLQQVQHVVGARTTLPILSNVLIEAADGKLKLTTTDLDVGVTGEVAAEVTERGATTLPARRLGSIIGALPTSEISISVDSKNVASIQSGPSFFKILGLDEEEFPPLPDFGQATEFTLPQAAMKDSLKKTSYAISSDETRYVLNGTLFSFKEGRLTMVATDGRRLAMVDLEVEFPQSQETEIIVPAKAVSELSRLLADEGELTIRISDGQISFELNQNLLVSKLIDGNYPNYRQVIPMETNERVTIDREMLFTTAHRVSLLTTEKSHSIKMVFAKDSLTISANAPDIGEAKEEIPIAYSGKEMAIAFNPDFLMAPLRNLEEDELHLHLIDEMSPGVFKNQGTFLYVLMPMRVSS